MPPIFLKELSYFRTVIIMGYGLACLAPGFAQEAGPVFGSYEDRTGEIYSGYFDFSELDNNVILFLGEKKEAVSRLIPDSIVKVEAGEDLFILTNNQISMSNPTARFFLPAGLVWEQSENANLEFLFTYSEDKEVFNTTYFSNNGILARRLTFSLTYLYKLNYRT